MDVKTSFQEQLAARLLDQSLTLPEFIARTRRRLEESYRDLPEDIRASVEAFKAELDAAIAEGRD